VRERRETEGIFRAHDRRCAVYLAYGECRECDARFAFTASFAAAPVISIIRRCEEKAGREVRKLGRRNGASGASDIDGLPRG